jgi:hypothetical protein
MAHRAVTHPNRQAPQPQVRKSIAPARLISNSRGSRPFLAIFQTDHDHLVGGPGGRSADPAPRWWAGFRISVAVGSRARVEKHDLIVKDHKFIAPLRCDECGGNAHLTRRSPHPVDGLETRVFECHECGHQTKQIVKP